MEALTPQTLELKDLEIEPWRTKSPTPFSALAGDTKRLLRIGLATTTGLHHIQLELVIGNSSSSS